MEAKLIKVWTHFSQHGPQLRLDWSNDRHQSINIKSLEGDDVAEGLMKLARLVKDEVEDGKI